MNFDFFNTLFFFGSIFFCLAAVLAVCLPAKLSLQEALEDEKSFARYKYLLQALAVARVMSREGKLLWPKPTRWDIYKRLKHVSITHYEDPSHAWFRVALPNLPACQIVLSKDMVSTYPDLIGIARLAHIKLIP